jgi:hypothetical protein
MASFGLLSKCVGARVMGVAMVISAGGEGVKFCHAPPSPSSDRSSPAQSARKTVLRTEHLRKIFLCGRNARDGGFDGDCSLGGGGWSACVPLPLARSLVARQNARKSLAGSSDTPPFAARALAPPPRQISKKGTKTLRRTLVFFLHTYATVLTHWL